MNTTLRIDSNDSVEFVHITGQYASIKLASGLRIDLSNKQLLEIQQGIQDSLILKELLAEISKEA